MSKYEQKNNSGSLFNNDKCGNQNKPDFKGTLVVDGKHYWISAWEKVSSKGTNWISLSVEPQERPDVSAQVPATQGRPKPSNERTAQQARPQPPPEDDWDSSVPF